jgi:hypothetical protein
MRYEYVEAAVDLRKMHISDVMNVRGREGWRLVHLYPAFSKYPVQSFIMERELPDD